MNEKAKYSICRYYPHFFPTTFITPTTLSDLAYLKTYINSSSPPSQIPSSLGPFSSLSLPQFLSQFAKTPQCYDLHEVYFQNFALSVTAGLPSEKLRKWSISSKHAKRRLVRAMVYAVSTRPDITWEKQFISDPEEMIKKQREIEQYMLSATLYSWLDHNPSKDKTPHALHVNDKEPDMSNQRKTKKRKTEYLVIPKDTQFVLESLYQKSPEKKIAWLNLANGHNTCGTYNVNYGGSQEEEVSTNCNGAAILGLQSEVISSDRNLGSRRPIPFPQPSQTYKPVYLSSKGSLRTLVSKEDHIVYRRGRHIPPGGNYFCKTRFITSPSPVECYMIAAAFTDLRTYVPFFVPYSERPFYHHLFGYGGVKLLPELEERLLVDMEGVIKTAIFNGIEILVLGASGCGAFRHCPWKEAELWKKLLYTKYSGYFELVVFAIQPDPQAEDNLSAFQIAFSGQPIFPQIVLRKCSYYKADFVRPLFLGFVASLLVALLAIILEHYYFSQIQ